ncbi:MAG: alpha/beta family hydrolase [Bacteroidota bacterium]
MESHLDHDLEKIHLKIDEATAPKAVIIIAHGAGAGMDHPFMQSIAHAISQRGIHAVRFNFPYMEAGRKSPGSSKKNIEAWRVVIPEIQKKYPALPIFLSGKSYGGRMASHLLAETPIDGIQGIIYFGFPLHAPGKVGKERADHLDKINVPQLFLQGTRDKLATIGLIKEVVATLKDASLYEIPDGDHSFKVPKSASLSQDETLKLLTDQSISFIEKMTSSMQL